MTRPAKKACRDCGRYSLTVVEGSCQTCAIERDRLRGLLCESSEGCENRAMTGTLLCAEHVIAAARA